ncbi:MAG: DNA repair protein RecN [Paludibacteraceae bacterium]|nr:DNA repair protein RecN [Paludibacteraceae bacterium]MBR1922353.1 DNA repair protein RecN [Paludibacteraceae bacterium]
MLTHLHIQNYALISHLDIDFGEGFSVLTGETGAGKSIILGALALVMGNRADTKSITEGESLCIIEATFTQPDGDSDNSHASELLIRRELHRNGRSRSFVNDEVVSQAELKQLAARLIDIHSQHENLLLGDDSFQLGIVDAIAFGKNNEPLLNYSTLYERYIALRNDLSRLQEEARKARADADYLCFQRDQLAEAQLREGEEDELTEEAYRLNHAEEIQTNLQGAIQTLSAERGIISLLHNIRLETASKELTERLESVRIELADIADETQRLAERTEINPQRLAEVEERISLIDTLKRKHNVQTADELIALLHSLEKQCEHIDSYDEEIAALQKELNKLEQLLAKAADCLTTQRKKCVPPIILALTDNLTKLGIRHAKVDVAISPLSDYTPQGKDDVQFLFAANLNQTPRRVSEVASGGEMSRLMLCIKALIASTNGLPTIIFDEIDTGVSGEIAARMGEIMQQMAHSRQIIAITHLPQIAAMGDAQYKVYKQDTDRRTETSIRLLSQDERIEEIASMLSGSTPTPAARDNALQLLRR